MKRLLLAPYEITSKNTGFLAFFLYLRKYAYIGFHIGVDDYENTNRNDETN